MSRFFAFQQPSLANLEHLFNLNKERNVMAEIVISRSFEALALSKPSAQRKARRAKQRTPNNKRNLTKRLTRNQFLELSKPEQTRYLERFPKSKHRRLLKGEQKPKKAQPTGKPKSKGPVKQKDLKKAAKRADTSEKFTKKISREEFDKLSKKDQREYKKKYPKDSFRGKKHFVAKKPNAVQQKKTGDDGETVMDGSEGLKEARNKRKLQNKALKQERNDARQEIRHGVTREAVKALQDTKPEDLKKAAKNLGDNRTENLKTIKDTLDSKHEYVSFKKNDIDTAKDALKAEQDNEDSGWSQEDLKKAEKVVKSLKEGDTNKLTKEDRDLLDRLTEDRQEFPTKREPFWKRDLKVLKGFMTGEQLDPEGRSNAMLALAVVSRYALLGAGISMIAMGAAPAALHIAQTLFGQWDDFNALSSAEDDDETDDALAAAYDAITDHLANMDHEEMVEDVGSVFKEFSSTSASASDSVMQDMLNMVLKLGCRVERKSEDSISGRRRSVKYARLVDGVERIALEHGYRKISAESDKVEGLESFDVRFASGDDMVVFLADGGQRFTVFRNSRKGSMSLEKLSY